MIIVTDTLATTPDRRPLLFQPKAWHLPHLNMAMATTGTANLGSLWSERIRSSALARDVGMLDAVAPGVLREIWGQLREEFGDPGSATIYHFGFESGRDGIVRYTYRSVTGFVSERVTEPGFGVRPPPETFELEVPYTLDEFIDLAKKVRAENDERRVAVPVGIGGELHLMLLEDGRCSTSRIYRFEDFEVHFREMMHLARQSPHFRTE
ncbi:hypothetical protein MMM2322_01337 [Microbacterium sp. MM2322]